MLHNWYLVRMQSVAVRSLQVTEYGIPNGCRAVLRRLVNR